MAIERRRPLPPGRYWADIFPQNRVMWDAWVKLAGESGALHGEVSEHFDATDGAPEHDFVIFVTNRELAWSDSDMGFAPNVAGSDVHSSNDTAQKPPPIPSAVDQISSGIDSLKSAVAVGVGVAVAAVVVVLLASLVRKKR